MTVWSQYRARWRGEEYPVSPSWRPDGLWLRLRRTSAADGFEAVTDTVHVRAVPAGECAAITFVTTVCRWRGVACQVREQRPGELLLEYVGGSAPQAADLGFERVERGVYRRWVSEDEARGRRENIELIG